MGEDEKSADEVGRLNHWDPLLSQLLIPSPRRWLSNPQAMAALNGVREYSGAADLGRQVDPDTWLTPRWILDGLGPFDLDPAAAIEEPLRCAPRSFTKLDNGLEQSWTGRVWLNPPFSDTAPWIARHAAHGSGITLVPSAVESRAWRQYVWRSARAVLLLHGRTRFCNPDGSVTTGRPLRSVALIAWGPYDREVLSAVPFAGVLLSTWSQR